MGTQTAYLVPLVLAIAAADAFAQAPGAAAPAEPEKTADSKSPIVAASLSTGIPLAGLGIALASRNSPGGVIVGVGTMYLGPSVGQWYAGGSAAIGLLGRTGGGLVMLVGVQKWMARPADCDPEADPGCDDVEAEEAASDRDAKRWFYAGATIWAAATVYDLVMAYRTAGEGRRTNAVTVAPVVVTAGAGVGLSGRF